MQLLCNKNQLDDTVFKGRWAGRGREYRLLVEPVDIANYYYMGHHLRSGHYIDGIDIELRDDNSRRPGRYLLLQQQEQRVFGSRHPEYKAESSLGVARLLKERVGSMTWEQYAASLNEAS